MTCLSEYYPLRSFKKHGEFSTKREREFTLCSNKPVYCNSEKRLDSEKKVKEILYSNINRSDFKKIGNRFQP